MGRNADCDGRTAPRGLEHRFRPTGHHPRFVRWRGHFRAEDVRASVRDRPPRHRLTRPLARPIPRCRDTLRVRISSSLARFSPSSEPRCASGRRRAASSHRGRARLDRRTAVGRCRRTASGCRESFPRCRNPLPECRRCFPECRGALPARRRSNPPARRTGRRRRYPSCIPVHALAGVSRESANCREGSSDVSGSPPRYGNPRRRSRNATCGCRSAVLRAFASWRLKLFAGIKPQRRKDAKGCSPPRPQRPPRGSAMLFLAVSAVLAVTLTRCCPTRPTG